MKREILFSFLYENGENKMIIKRIDKAKLNDKDKAFLLL